MSRHLRKDEIVFKHDFFDSAKFLTVDLAATGLFVCAVAHSHRNEHDGLIPSELLPRLGRLSDLGIADGALTGLYVPASHDALARRLVRSGLFHEVSGGFEIHDYSDYQETTLSRQLRRRRDVMRKKVKPPGSAVGAESERNRSGSTDAMSSRASEALGSRSIPTISGSDHPEHADDSQNDLKTADYGSDLEWLRRISADLRGADSKTPLVLGSVMRGMPESVMRDGLERLERRRRNTKRSPIVNEAKYLVTTLQDLVAERRKDAA